MNGVTPDEATAEQPKSSRRGTVLAGIFLAIVLVWVAVLVVWWVRRNGNGDRKEARAGLPPAVPSAAPITGPGQFACDPFGTCNVYEEWVREGCPKTYADRHCQSECEKKDVRCKK